VEGEVSGLCGVGRVDLAADIGIRLVGLRRVVEGRAEMTYHVGRICL
jgi:hypothetical protein